VEQDLISKKELLELTGISYGQLYRWKRKNLIPEDWFIRKSTFTGQETFFPRDKILARIDRIKNMKEDLSLDELADMLSPNPAEVTLRLEELRERNIVTELALKLYLEQHGETQVFSFEKLLYLYVLDVALRTGEISLEEGKVLLQTMAEHYAKFRGKSCELMFVRKLGIATCLLAASPSEVYFESGARVVVRLNIPTCIEQLKLKLA
jgi:DNA-binding transcriptional MerR regulator